MAENSTPKATKASTAAPGGAAKSQQDHAAASAKPSAGKPGPGETSAATLMASAAQAAQPMVDALDQIAKAQAEFAQQMGFDPKTFAFNPAKFGLEGNFGLDKAFGDKIFGAGMPRFDLLFVQHQKNIESFFRAQASLVDGVQAVYRRQVALLQEAVTEASQLMQALLAEKDSRTGAEKQVEASKKAFEKILSEAKELGAVMSKSQNEAFQVLNQRALEQIEEIKSACEKSA